MHHDELYINGKKRKNLKMIAEREKKQMQELLEPATGSSRDQKYHAGYVSEGSQPSSRKNHTPRAKEKARTTDTRMMKLDLHRVLGMINIYSNL